MTTKTPAALIAEARNPATRMVRETCIQVVRGNPKHRDAQLNLCDDAEAMMRQIGELADALEKALATDEDICGLCGQPGKIPHPVHWPGEQVPDTELVHAECERIECERAHAAMTDEERKRFLRSV